MDPPIKKCLRDFLLGLELTKTVVFALFMQVRYLWKYLDIERQTNRQTDKQARRQTDKLSI